MLKINECQRNDGSDPTHGLVVFKQRAWGRGPGVGVSTPSGWRWSWRRGLDEGMVAGACERGELGFRTATTNIDFDRNGHDRFARVD